MSDSPKDSAPNPLLEVKPGSLAEVMNADPFGWSQADVQVIVSALRKQRREHVLAEAEGKIKGKKAGPKGKAPTSLEDLGL